MRKGLAGAVALLVAGGMLAAPSATLAQGPLGPLNDLVALGQGEGQTPDTVPIQKPAGPPLEAAPRAHCDAASKPEPDIQGRVPAGSATDGLWCNVHLIGHEGGSGGFKVFRYIDGAGHECAYYDTALLFPLNAIQLNSSGQGVEVLDMSDPAHPQRTDVLTEPPMLSPHESLNLNPKRGLLAAVDGNPSTYPGLVSIYDVSQDCRHPVLQSTALVARFGHESGFSSDGKTFYATGTAVKSITAIDVTDPKAPHPIWQGNVLSHGMSLSDDGNRGYIADATGHNMLILDTSEIQARKPDPQAREISRLTWDEATIPQNAIPFTSKGKPYVLEFDEYSGSASPNGGDADDVGAGRIIDISDEKQPKVVSNIRLQVDQRADHHAAQGDPGAQSPVQGYAAHYCNIPTRTDPTLVACSFIASGLRVFDIRDVTAPKEIAYFVAPTKDKIENGEAASNFAMSMPAFAPERHEIWYADGTTGFYDLRLDDGVWPEWPTSTGARGGPGKSCDPRSRVRVNVRLPRGARVRSISAKLAGQTVRTVKRSRRRVRVTVNLRGAQRSTARLVVRVKLRSGRTLVVRRTYHPCVGQ